MNNDNLNQIKNYVIEILDESSYPKFVKGIIYKLQRMNIISYDDKITYYLTLWLNSDKRIKRVQAGKRKYKYTLKSKISDEK